MILKRKMGIYTYRSGDGDFHLRKREAEKQARKERHNGYNARIVKVKGGYRVFTTTTW